MSPHEWIWLVFGVGILIAAVHGIIGGRKYRSFGGYIVSLRRQRDEGKISSDVFEELMNKDRREKSAYSSSNMFLTYTFVVGSLMVLVTWWVLTHTGFTTDLLGEFWYVGIYPPILGAIYALCHDLFYDMFISRDDYHGNELATVVILGLLGWLICNVLWVMGFIVAVVIIVSSIIGNVAQKKKELEAERLRKRRAV